MPVPLQGNWSSLLNTCSLLKLNTDLLKNGKQPEKGEKPWSVFIVRMNLYLAHIYSVTTYARKPQCSLEGREQKGLLSFNPPVFFHAQGNLMLLFSTMLARHEAACFFLLIRYKMVRKATSSQHWVQWLAFMSPNFRLGIERCNYREFTTFLYA